MKRYLFFLRHYNDIDNITPAIYFFLKASSSHRADIVLYDGRYDFRNNPNLCFLRDSFPQRFSYTWLGNYFDLELDTYLDKEKISQGSDFEANLSHEKIFIPLAEEWEKLKVWIQQGDRASQRLLFLSPLGPLRWARQWWRRFQRWWHIIRRQPTSPPPSGTKDSKPSLRINDICCGQIDGDLVFSGVKLILEENGFPSLVIFDINRSVPIAGLLAALRAGGVPKIIALPVSPLINYNVLREEKFVNIYSQYFQNQHDYSGIDKLAYVDDHFVNAFNHFFQVLGQPSTLAGKTLTLGSLRYSPQWLETREKFVPQYQRQSNKTKVVFFPSHAKSNVNWKEFERSLELISLFPDYDVVVKYHTRQNIHLGDTDHKNISYETDIESSALINWSDIVVFWSSSIAIEGYIKEKTMVCLSYIVGNKNLYVDYNAGYIAKCRDDFLFFLLNFPRYPKLELPGYNKSGVRNLLEKNILRDGGNIVNNYLKFMKINEF